MARYLLLRIDDDAEADHLLHDLVTQPYGALLTPGRHQPVHAELVPDFDPGDFSRDELGIPPESHPARARGLRAVLRRSYLRASELADEWETAG